MQILLVGGTFNVDGGRPSGLFGKLVQALYASIPNAVVQVLNGGTYDALQSAVAATGRVSHVLWFADVPNDLPKLLPVLKALNPGMVLVSSKNNRRKLYERPALFERLRKSRSELLVEFGEGDDGKIVASVLTAYGEVRLENSGDMAEVACSMAAYFKQLRRLRFPLEKARFHTTDLESFRQRNLLTETEIPMGEHPGAFGVVRRNHSHEGVDLYGYPGEPVYAMESGIVVARKWFTGEKAGSPWWNDTECLLVKSASGVINYGEIKCVRPYAPGSFIAGGQQLGELVPVLKNDKGRPRTMLHIERYAYGTCLPILEWSKDTPQPECLCDPTAMLVQAEAYYDE